ncbi:hypothetical protein Y694_03461 [Methylibium sp. T29-B]|nr:hypothetical protein Y694_03461 [Methylibium sp. T29-B]
MPTRLSATIPTSTLNSIDATTPAPIASRKFVTSPLTSR